MPAPVTAEAVLEYMTTPGLGHDIPALVARYRQISVEQPRLFAAPAEDRILAKLVWPLRHAKASYVAGNFLGTVSLCGMVAEMVAILIFETSDVRVNGAPMDKAMQASVFGSAFEKLGQERRVAVLRAYKLIDARHVTAFDSLRLVRRRYLHLWSQNHDSLPQDAIKAFLAAMQLVVAVIGHGVATGGRLQLTPTIARYLARTPNAAHEDDNEPRE
jgi:hypothetical protein